MILSVGGTRCHSKTTRREIVDEEKRREGKCSESKNDQVKKPSKDHSQVKKAIKVVRAKEWNEQVEENYRLQSVGWKDIFEYRAKYGEPDRWEENGYIKCLRVQKNGYFTYWRSHPECESKSLNTVKIYSYEN